MSVINLRGLPPARQEDAAQRLQALRALVAEKYPSHEIKAAGIFPTGLAEIDETEGGLRRGALTEVVAPTGAGALCIAALCMALNEQAAFGALIDPANSFDPQGADPVVLPRLLWVRPDGALPAMKATDLLLRDGNLPLLLLDLQAVPLREIRKVPASTWHRFQRLAEPGGTVLLVLSTRPLVEGAQVRIALRQRWTLTAMRERRTQLLQRLEAQVFSRREFAQMPGQSSQRKLA